MKFSHIQKKRRKFFLLTKLIFILIKRTDKSIYLCLELFFFLLVFPFNAKKPNNKLLLLNIYTKNDLHLYIQFIHFVNYSRHQ